MCKLCDADGNFGIIYKTEAYYLAFDNYGLHYGHLLIIPGEHILNLSNADTDFISAVGLIVSAMKDFFQKDIVLYEHGNTTENKTENISIDHAHMHLLPLNGGIEKIESDIMPTVQTDFEEFYSKRQPFPYHFVSLNGVYSFYTYNVLASQAFRRAYALSEGAEKWDWKKDGSELIAINSNHAEKKHELREFLVRRLNNADNKLF